MITLRVCTMKSRIGAGTHGNTPIETVIAANQESWVRYVYYNIEHIDFNDEVKKAAKILIDIPKPGIDREAGRENERRVRRGETEQMTDLERIKRFQHIMRLKRQQQKAVNLSNFYGKQISKAQLRDVNQGKAKLNKI